MSSLVGETIGKCQLFSQVHSDRLAKLEKVALTRKFRKGQTIFRQSAPCPGVFIVAGGTVRLFKIGATGKEHVLHLVNEGETFGEVAAIGGFPCPAHAEAVSDTTTVLLPFDAFRQQMASDHALCLEMLAGLSFWVRHVVTLLEDVVLRDATARVARFLLDAESDAEDVIKLPGLKRYVASHLNLTSETFSRTLSRLIEAGLIHDLDNNRVRLVSRQRLEAVSAGKFPRL